MRRTTWGEFSPQITRLSTRIRKIGSLARCAACFAVSRVHTFSGEDPRNAKTRLERRASLSAEAEEFMYVTVMKFPEIEPPVKWKHRFR
jgi:hypothetical protein